MATAQFSEFSFGFAYTYEVVSSCWAELDGAPLLPSLFDEGHHGGFDVSLGLLGWTYFAQFKRADYLSRSNAKYWAAHGGTYFRIPLARPKDSLQHELLLELEAQSVFHVVEYVAPRFHSDGDLSAFFAAGSVIENSMRVFPHSIGALPDDDQHYLTYSNVGPPTFRSEPFQVEPPYNAGPLAEPTLPTLQSAPIPLNSANFAQIAERLLEAASDLGFTVDPFAERVVSLSPFGRARTLGRLLVGAELIPVVIGQAAAGDAGIDNEDSTALGRPADDPDR